MQQNASQQESDPLPHVKITTSALPIAAVENASAADTAATSEPTRSAPRSPTRGLAWQEKLAWGLLIAAVIAVIALLWNESKLEQADRKTQAAAHRLQQPAAAAAAAAAEPGYPVAKAVDAGTDENTRREAARRELEQREYEVKLAKRLEAAKSAAQAFAGMMKTAGAWGSLIFDVAPNKLSPTILGIGVTSTWSLLPMEERRKNAVMFWRAWAAVNESNEPRQELSKIWLVDERGRRVGGSSDWGAGSRISVDD